MQTALNAIWKAKPKGATVSRFVRARAASLGLVAALGFLLMVSLVVSTGLTAFGNYLDSVLPFGKIILMILNGIVSIRLSLSFSPPSTKYCPTAAGMARRVIGAIVTGSCSPSASRSSAGTSEAVPLPRASAQPELCSSSFCGSIIQRRYSCSGRNSPRSMPIGMAACTRRAKRPLGQLTPRFPDRGAARAASSLSLNLRPRSHRPCRTFPRHADRRRNCVWRMDASSGPGGARRALPGARRSALGQAGGMRSCTRSGARRSSVKPPSAAAHVVE